MFESTLEYDQSNQSRDLLWHLWLVNSSIESNSTLEFFVVDPFHGISLSSKMHFVPFLEIAASHIHQNCM